MHILPGAGEIFSKTSLRQWVPAGTARKSWGTGGFLRSSFPGIQGKDSCIVVLDQGGKLPLIGCLVMTFSTWNLFIHGGNSRNFCEATGFSTILMLHTGWGALVMLVFLWEKCIWSPERIKERHGIVWNLMMHGYAYFLQGECYFVIGAQRGYRKYMKW